MGEPLAHPKITEILNICEEENVQIQITTNGLLIKRYADLLTNCKIVRQVNFSVQSYTDNFPEKRIDGYLGEILKFVRESFEVRPLLYTNIRLWNFGDAKSFEANIPILDFIDKYFEIQINRNIEVGNIKSKRIWNRLYLHFDSRFEWPGLDNEFKSNKGRCNGLLRHIGIHSDGSVVPCCLDSEAVMNLGNCLQTPLEEILKSDRAVKMKEGFLKKELVEEMCQKCDYIQRFTK
jgi:radical SAM protein with 4Fe4S-binding SPASM domain